MAITQTDVDNLDLAIVAGELKVRLDGREVTYHSKAELLAARAHAASLVASAAGRVGPRHQLADFSDD
jgi:DNA-binding response OmpR family regulator